MRALRSIRLVAMREIQERGRSRGYLLSLLFTLLLLAAGFILPALLTGSDTEHLAVVEPAAAGARRGAGLGGGHVQRHARRVHAPRPCRRRGGRARRQGRCGPGRPPDLSGPGQLIVHRDASSELQAIAAAAVIGLRASEAAPLLAPPAITALEPPSAADTTALIFANAGIILMFIGIFSYGTWVLTGVVEEKQSRVVEVVLSTVRPRDLLVGKVLGIGLLALFQLAVLVAAGLIAVQISGRLTLPTTTVGSVVQLLVWFILGFALYSTTMGFLGSLASRTEDASSAAMPVTMTATACYIASIVLVQRDPDGALARVMTFFPPAAPMVVPLRTALGAIEPWEVVVSIVLMLVAIWALFVVGARVYAGAVLQVGSRMKIRDAWRARS